MTKTSNSTVGCFLIARRYPTSTLPFSGQNSGLTLQHNSLAHNIKLCAATLPMFKAPETAVGASPPMISIVDDDESVRESTKALVRSLGYAARTFPSIEEFLCSNLNDTSCLILDVQLKGLSGIELQERLIGEGRRTPIIFITAVLDEQIRNQALKAGAIDILSKPFSDERLASCLVSAVSKEEAPAGGDGAS